MSATALPARTLTLLGAVVVLHILAYVGLPIPAALIIVMGACTILTFGAGLLELREIGQRSGKPYPLDASDVLRQIPQAMLIMGALLIVYTAANSVSVSSQLPGVPEQNGAEFVLRNHGEILKTLTPDEYRAYVALQGRLFTGGLVLFAYVALCFRVAIGNGGMRKREPQPAGGAQPNP